MGCEKESDYVEPWMAGLVKGNAFQLQNDKSGLIEVGELIEAAQVLRSAVKCQMWKQSPDILRHQEACLLHICIWNISCRICSRCTWTTQCKSQCSSSCRVDCSNGEPGAWRAWM